MVKEIQEKWVLFTNHTIQSPMDIGPHVSTDEPALQALAEKHGLTIAGPLEHGYWNMAVHGAPHILEIWLPVHARENAPSLPALKRIPPYKCLATDFKRPIEDIGDGWMELGAMAKSLGHQLTNHDREVYKFMDCDHPEKNDIELQIGIL